MTPSTLTVIALATLLQLIWGLTPSASHAVLEFLPVETYSAIRYSISGLIFLAYTVRIQGRFMLRRADIPAIALIGVLAYAINSLGTLYGLRLGGVLNFALASSCNTVIMALVAIVVLRERFDRWLVAACALSLGGGVFLALGKYALSGFEVAFGSLALILIAYVLEAFGFVFSKKLRERVPLTEYLTVAQLAAGAFMWFLCFTKGQSPAAVFALPTHALASLAFVCLVSCCLCYFLLYWLLNFMEGSRLAFFDCFHTLSAAAFGVIFFDDPLNAKMLLGGILLTGSVAAVSWSQLRKKPGDEGDPKKCSQGGSVLEQA